MPLEETYRPGNPVYAGTDWLVVLSGCSGGGKSTLISEMADRGYPVKTEVGRQIVREQIQIGGDGLPWINVTKFMDLGISRAMWQFNTAEPKSRPVFFDRSLIDFLAFFQREGAPIPQDLLKAANIYRYARRVFMVPPWENIFCSEPERPKDFAEAVQEFQALEITYRKLGYELIEIPRMPVSDRADFLEASLTA